ncbi:MAG: hypothetical protein HN348_32830, partial [Proteobacteria bacterium]|nr:hypothetical protein [Pseudomonadota bacterium]
MLVFALLAKIALAIDPVAAIESHQQALFSQTAPGVVFVSNSQGFGSGVVVAANGLILTNKHVVGDDETVEVVLHNGTRHIGQVVEGATELDLALVQLDVEGLHPLNWGDLRQLRVGSWVASVGHGRGGAWTFTTGMVSNIYP